MRFWSGSRRRLTARAVVVVCPGVMMEVAMVHAVVVVAVPTPAGDDAAGQNGFPSEPMHGSAFVECSHYVRSGEPKVPSGYT